jgi:hypothetical protein
MSKLITRGLLEGPPHGRSMNGGLFGRDRRGRIIRAVREGDDPKTPRDHMVMAAVQAMADGDHETARSIHDQLREWDDAENVEEGDEDTPEEGDMNDSQAARGKPEKSGYNTTTSARGVQGMESRQRRSKGRGSVNVLESARRQDQKGRLWARRLLSRY